MRLIRTMKLIDLKLIVFSKKFRFVWIALAVYVLARIVLENTLLRNDHGDIVDQIHSRGLKAVQLLTRKFTHLEWGMGDLGTKPFERCVERRCYAFKNDFFLQRPLEKSDGVMVHLQNLFYMPSRDSYRRSRRQLWLFNTMEPQTFSFCSAYYDVDDLDDWFNITTTFKPQSTLLTDYKDFSTWESIVEYGAYYHEFAKIYAQNQNFLTDALQDISKREPVLWMVSHCDTPSQREKFVNELRKHVGTSIFGSCGFARPDPCRGNDMLYDTCSLDLLNSYKFYLAFENTKCDYYITEKYWKIYRPSLIFHVHTVPVVRGAPLEHYLQAAPDNHSFIYADSFATPRELADYLLYLDRNATAYAEYFTWKFRLVDKFREHLGRHELTKVIDRRGRDDSAVFCEMCAKLHNETYLNAQNPIIYISEFFNPTRDCRNDRPNDNLIEFFLKFIGFCT